MWLLITTKTANLLNILGQIRGTTPEVQQKLDEFLKGLKE